MTQPKQVLPGRMICITRRCSERRFFLRPDPATIQLLEYLLAYAAGKYGLKLVAVVAMSNHIHVLLYDPNGRCPDFTRTLDSLMAKAMNCYRGRTDAFWAAEDINVLELADPDTVIDKICYLAANPVAAMCVEFGRDWPGLRSNPQSFLAEPKEIRRPSFFFRNEGGLPDTVSLKYEIPPTHDHLDVEEFVALVAKRVADREAKHRHDAKRDGKKFLGVRGVKQVNWRSRPKSRERRGPHKIRPNVAASTAEIRNAVLARIKKFRRDYRDARDALVNGDRDVVFPMGTWQLRFLVRCRAAP